MRISGLSSDNVITEVRAVNQLSIHDKIDDDDVIVYNNYTR